MQKRGQMQMSFGMIFSIIIIIATIGVAFYVIGKFVKTGECVQAGIFYEDLEEEIDKAWRAPRAETVFEHSLPSSVESVCFGAPEGLSDVWEKERESLKRDARRGGNAFFYPSGICENLGLESLEHVSIPTSFCSENIQGKISIHIIKSSSGDKAVTLKP